MSDETEKKETAAPEADSDKAKKAEPPPPIVTQHEMTVNGRTLKYTVTTGMMAMKATGGENDGEILANIFYMAYTLDEPERGPQRPLTFAFNGGPGSASVWLHLGALGPKRVQMQAEGWMPAPPYKLVDNEHTWLDQTDLVFIDPVGTGFSRATKADHNKKYWNLQGDLEAVGEFIRLYLTRYGRWSSPLFMAGESYGTTRAAGLAGYLIDKGIAFNGIILVSTVMNFQTLRFGRGNDLPFSVYLPTYTATAWYHHKLAPELQGKPLTEVLAEAEEWALSDYTLALMRGDQLSEEAHAHVVERLAYYTGLEPRYIDQTNLRIDIIRFCKELLRDQKRTVGRLDSRFQGVDANATTDTFDFDPSLTAITPPYTAMMNDYVRNDLGYETDVEYNTLSFEVNGNWEFERGTHPDTSEALRSAFAKNPYMRVLVAQGYYDLATPHVAAQYTLSHMELPPAAHENVRFSYYEAGHMFYLDVGSLAKFREEVGVFLREALG